MNAPLVSKSRAAAELREQAHKLRAELADPALTLTADEVGKRTDAIRALELRAQAAAEFTPDAEIDRQGGEAGLWRIKSPGRGAEQHLHAQFKGCFQ